MMVLRTELVAQLRLPWATGRSEVRQQHQLHQSEVCTAMECSRWCRSSPWACVWDGQLLRVKGSCRVHRHVVFSDEERPLQLPRWQRIHCPHAPAVHAILQQHLTVFSLGFSHRNGSWYTASRLQRHMPTCMGQSCAQYIIVAANAMCSRCSVCFCARSCAPA